jgi:ribosomal protein S18 acetylase RimI-like enzyme
MELTGSPEFDHRDREELYQHIESRGPTEPDAARRALNMDERAFGHHVAILERDGVLEETDGLLRVAFEAAAREEFETDGVSFTIRRAREEDLTGLVGAIREAVGGGEYVGAETVADVVDSEGVLLRYNEIELRIFFVACVDSEVVGWVHLKHPELEKLAHTAEITIGVLEEYRGHGIGSRLLERALEWANANGLEKLYNSVPASNESAIEFLESRDWAVEAVRENHYKLDGEYLDEVMMAKEICSSD